MDHLLVDVELSVTDKVHVTLGTPVVMLLWGHVGLPHVSLPVLQREEGEVAVDTFGLPRSLTDHLALPGLDMSGEVGQVEPAGPAQLTDVGPDLSLTLSRGHVAGVVELVGPVFATPPALEGWWLVANTRVALSHVLLDAGPDVGGEDTAHGLAPEQTNVVLVEARLVLHQQVGSWKIFKLNI